MPRASSNAAAACALAGVTLAGSIGLKASFCSADCEIAKKATVKTCTLEIVSVDPPVLSQACRESTTR